MNIAEHTIVNLPDRIFHKGTEVQPTGKVAIEVHDPKTGRIAWVRSVDESAKPPAKPAEKAQPTTVKARAAQPAKQAKPRSRTNKPAAKKAAAK